MRTGLLLLLGCLLAGAASCGGAPRRQVALLRVIADPPTARVYVDDQFIAGARRLAVRPEPLPVGPHQITVEAEGCFPHDVELDLPHGVTTVRVSLRRVPP